jgi:uncharacterized caspase-like protein
LARRLAALVIGNASYQYVAPLVNSINDADDMSSQLAALGFSVRTLKDASTQQMEQAVIEFRSNLEQSSVGLMFFAGHGFQIYGKNYLAGIDTKDGDELAVKYSALDLDMVLDAMKVAAAPTGFIILDACRNNPFAGRARSIASSQLAPVYAPKGTLVAFSTSPGQVALDGSGRNGYYTQALLQHIATPNLLIETMFKRVRSTLESLTNGRQTSWEHTSLVGDFRFQLSAVAGASQYGPTATGDGLFPRNARASGKLIQALKSLNWYTQNAAIDGFTLEDARASTTDELFVIGRNIYQAACGNANSALEYIAKFKEKTEGLEELQRKAILDGILYEIFFNAEGQHRANPKIRQIDLAFNLQVDPALASSFEFLKGCLAPFADSYFVVPGSGDGATVTVAASQPNANGNRIVEAVWLDSTNIFHQVQTRGTDSWFGFGRDRTLDFSELREYLSEKMIIPKRLLTIETRFPYTDGTRFIVSGDSFIGRPGAETETTAE